MKRREMLDVLRALLDRRTWRRHPTPFSKSRRGKARREARRFVAFNRGLALD